MSALTVAEAVARSSRVTSPRVAVGSPLRAVRPSDSCAPNSQALSGTVVNGTAGTLSVSGAHALARGISVQPLTLASAMVSAARLAVADLRTSARARFVLVTLPLVLAAAILAAMLGAHWTATLTGQQAAPAAVTHTVTVDADQSVWAFANAHAHGQNTSNLVAEVKYLNNLDTNSLHQGQAVKLPGN